MKIISGKYKGRVLRGFNLSGTRPTMDRVKESLFAMIQDYLSNSIVLDLFAGSGSLGIEALSEGAKKSYLVDSNYQAIKTIQDNINNLNIDNQEIEIIHADYLKALNSFTLNKTKFDLIFLDPPYQTDYIEKSIQTITKNDLLKADGLIICESDSQSKIVYSKDYTCIKEKKYGDKYIVILKKVC